jgi:hypothetical protein
VVWGLWNSAMQDAGYELPRTPLRNCLKSPDWWRTGALPGEENGSEMPPLGASRYRIPSVEDATATFQTVSRNCLKTLDDLKPKAFRPAKWGKRCQFSAHCVLEIYALDSTERLFRQFHYELR